MDAQSKRSTDGESQLPRISVSRTSTESFRSLKKIKDKSEHREPWKQSSRHDPPRLGPEYRSSSDWRSWTRKNPAWKRDRTPALQWRIKWDDHCFPDGRVLIIDYKSSDSTLTSGKRHIQIGAQEIQNLDELYKFYAHDKQHNGTALRVIHVQNAKWATMFLLRKFNINHPNEMLGMPGFGKWAQYDKPRQRNGKPYPDSRSWRGQVDPWRNITRSAFGMDYLKTFKAETSSQHSSTSGPKRPLDTKLMHLNTFEDDVRSPHGTDVSIQRLSVYVQRSLGASTHRPADVEIQNPYAEAESLTSSAGPKNENKIVLEALDNSSTVIVFETSASMLLSDCVVQPRDDLERRWRRLSFYLRRDDMINDSRLAAECTNIILGDIFHEIAGTWEHFLNSAGDHVALLEDKIYENPADESRASELWANQAYWLKVDKMLYLHSDLVKSVQGHLRDLEETDEIELRSEHEPLSNIPAEYEKILHAVSEDLVQPTNNLIDLMYKSVGIRDSRQSLQLSLSMWRLSWITFIFLPLTFIVSFFGMNVDILANYPSIGWYFLAAVVLMIFVLLLWYCVKHSLQRKRQTPYQRGLYEALFQNLEGEYPQIWTADGAADDVYPSGFIGRLKWHLIKRWFAPEQTINKQMYSSLAPDGDAEELGAWAGFKYYLLRRWLPQINASQTPHDDIALAENGESPAAKYEADTIEELLRSSTRVAMADGEPAAVAPLTLYGLRPLKIHGMRSNSSPRSSQDRPSSRGSDGMMIEERNLSDSESDAGEADPSDPASSTRQASS